MNKILTILKYGAAIAFTFLIAPGFGHLFLLKFKKAAILIGVLIIVVIISSMLIAASVDVNTIPKDYSLMKNYVLNILSGDSMNITAIYILVAALWSYAAADIVFMGLDDIKKIKGAK